MGLIRFFASSSVIAGLAEPAFGDEGTLATGTCSDTPAINSGATLTVACESSFSGKSKSDNTLKALFAASSAFLSTGGLSVVCGG